MRVPRSLFDLGARDPVTTRMPDIGFIPVERKLELHTFSLPGTDHDEDRYLLRGTTDGGRRIIVVFAYPVFVRRDWGVQELDMARPITAYDNPRRE